MEICPYCASRNIFFSRKRNKFFCEDCENSFDTPTLEKGVRIFLSYGHDKNAIVVQKIKEYLVSQGYDVWIDTSEIPSGKDWRERITNGLIGSDGIISFLSKHSVRNPGVCLDELKIAVCLKHADLNTILLENEQDVTPPAIISSKQWLDMSDWNTISEDQWNSYFLNKMSILMETLTSNESFKINEELEYLMSKLNVSDNTVKEQWLLKQNFFGREWLIRKVHDWFISDDSSQFMIYGIPGSGKSAFTAHLAQFNPDVLAIMYFEWDHSELTDIDEVIRILSLKLATRLSDYRTLIYNICKNEEKKIMGSHGATLFDMLILNPLHYCIDGDRAKKMIIFDGIDETSQEVAEFLIRKSKSFPNWIKVLFTSRYDDTVVDNCKIDNTVLIDNNHEQNYLDLKTLLAFRLNLHSDCETVSLLASKCEGSFMYANAFCDAIDDGSMSIEDANDVPNGLNNFYYVFFKRIFKDRKTFIEIRSFLEMLCLDENVPEEVISEILNLDHYGLWELRLIVKTLVIGDQSDCGLSGDNQYKIIRFVHKSIKDWLIDKKLSREFYIDKQLGYKKLVQYVEEYSLHINGEKVQLITLLITDKNKLYDNQIDKKNIITYLDHNYIKWLILSGDYDKAKTQLLLSFNSEEEAKNHNYANYTNYHKFFPWWKYADLFPLDYPIDELIKKFTELLLFPKRYIVSRYAHRSTQIAIFILARIIGSGRYKDALFALMENFSLARYFTSAASDDAETRLGWDKYYMARDVAICLKKLTNLQVQIPDNVRYACELMKLTYNYCEGDPNGGMFYHSFTTHWAYGILSEAELFKDICVLDNIKRTWSLSNERELQVIYNTTSLRFYLANSDEEDLDFIKECLNNLAILSVAINLALKDIEYKRDDYTGISIKLKNKSKRIDFLHKLNDLL